MLFYTQGRKPFIVDMTSKQKREPKLSLKYIITGRSQGIEMPIDFLYRKINILSKIMTTLFVYKKGENKWI